MNSMELQIEENVIIEGTRQKTFSIFIHDKEYKVHTGVINANPTIRFSGYERSKFLGFMKINDDFSADTVNSVIGFLEGKKLLITSENVKEINELAEVLGINIICEYAQRFINCAN